ncbi:mannitol dehydrogenase family protein [Actinopolymorpha singaporensis]|uniref:Mannitol-1-phosphate 5-dehydrogenase n=1 Tax=Actinopolymorpha singaporensis TaxID=117157 RepID=A0A1H1W815_9ACTN|nr:mannitol dehydrogenase family protein [Actinopolymorpha singaporensis]SDS92781.1 fructuronate reductase [Actinopolymorpha singaporensis]
MRRLTRAEAGAGDASPVRVVHLGLGAFFRAHQAWYTHRANTADPTGEPAGIVAFTGRRPDAARPLADQDGLYHLLVRDRDGDRTELVTSLSGAYDGADAKRRDGALADPAVSTVTLTITEAGYLRAADGAPDLADPRLAGDLERLRAGDSAVSTAPGRLLAGLAARRAADAGPLAVVPCDNLVDNGATVARVLTGVAEAVDDGLAAWVRANVSFVSTTVDRITPATTPGDREVIASLSGFADQAPVVTEPFTEWVLAGDFPAGRPAWEHAGARFVDDVRPFEQRKLWLLNGAHSLLAYAGPTRGHETVAEAIADPVCRGWVDAWWDAAARHLALDAADIAKYRDDLVERFANPRIRHALAQIAMDGSQKLPIRVLPVLTRERADGVLPEGGVVALAGWLAHLRDGTRVRDPRGEELLGLADGPVDDVVPRVLAVLDPALADDAELLAGVREKLTELAR